MIKDLLRRLVDWYTRPRSVGVVFIKCGLGLAALVLGAGIAIKLVYQSKGNGWSFSVGAGQEDSLILTIVFAVIAVVLLAIGAYVLFVEFRQEQRRRLIVIEIRGLHNSPDTPAVAKVLPSFRGQRHHLPLDFRPQSDSGRVDPNYLLERVLSMKPTLQTLVGGGDKRDVQVAVGGLAAVPAMFLVGMLIDDESYVQLYDWDRNTRCWRTIDGEDDLVRFLPAANLPPEGQASEAVLVIEASYSVNQADVTASFDNTLPIVRLSIEMPLADRFWSEKKQAELALQFRDTVQQLSALGVQRLHLIVAAPASLSLRFGMCYDRRLLPEVVVYQFEKGVSKPYPWGVQMPTVASSAAILLNR